MCSLGYILADEALQPVFNGKQEFAINPDAKEFTLPAKFAYKTERFQKSYTFKAYYDHLKKVFATPNRTILCYDVDAERALLDTTCKRYKLEPIAFNAIDVQQIFKTYTGRDEATIVPAARTFGVRFSKVKLYKSSDDAELAMKMLRVICAREKCTIAQLLKKYC